MVITQTTTPTRREDNALAVLRDFYFLLAGFRIAGNRTERHLQDNILALSAATKAFGTTLAVAGNHVLLVLQVQ